MDKRKLIGTLLVILGIVVIIWIFVANNNSTPQVEEEPNQVEEQDQQTVVPEEEPSGERTIKNKKVDDIVVTKAVVEYDGNLTLLRINVKNNGAKIESQLYTIYFLDEAGETIGETVMYLANLESGEEKYTEASVTNNFGDFADIKFEKKQ